MKVRGRPIADNVQLIEEQYDHSDEGISSELIVGFRDPEQQVSNQEHKSRTQQREFSRYVSSHNLQHADNDKNHAVGHYGLFLADEHS